MISETNPWLVLATISVALFLVVMDMTVLNVALPVLAHELNATNAEKLWMVNAYSLVLAGLLPGCGSLSDKIGHRKIFTGGLIIFGFASVMAALASSSAWLIFARGVLAIGAAMMVPATISIVRLAFKEDKERAVAIGIWGAVTASAAALGPLVGGVLLANFWWGAVFLINAPVVTLTLILTFVLIPNIPGNTGQHWNLLTSVILTVALISSLYALKSMLKSSTEWDEVLMAAVTGIVFIRWFLLRQKRMPAPLIDFALFRNIRFSVGIAGAFYASVVVVGLQFVLSQELQLAQSFTPLQAGLFVMPIAMGSIVAGPLLGSVLFRFGAERMMAFALGIATLGLILYTSMWLYSEPFWQIVSLGVTGFGLGGVMSVGSTLIMINAPEDKAGMAGALEGISYELGGTIGVAVMGSIMASVYSRTFTPPAEALLPPNAWDSLDQTLIVVSKLSAEMAEKVSDSGKATFMTGVSATLIGTTIITIVVFVSMAVYARNKRP
ncbi:MFS transporter [Salmonella enterica]|nr:MFS transporter [Salmonella enterica subsp. enterica serovar Umbilo]ECH9311221.1 MFS transporter [Salmonella enterica subsp. enterica]EDV3082070.1 MFS transporter [Salmonella enterica subsp. enterica]EEJ5142420.1 MFS transporter [Salmonella enterica subsp. enterica serovar Hadar]HAF5994558.1 MFS transporter [Salmonella enterica]